MLSMPFGVYPNMFSQIVMNFMHFKGYRYEWTLLCRGVTLKINALMLLRQRINVVTQERYYVGVNASMLVHYNFFSCECTCICVNAVRVLHYYLFV